MELVEDNGKYTTKRKALGQAVGAFLILT